MNLYDKNNIRKTFHDLTAASTNVRECLKDFRELLLNIDELDTDANALMADIEEGMSKQAICWKQIKEKLTGTGN